MSLDLNKLENKLDEALSNETSETLNKFLNDKRMTKETGVIIDANKLDSALELLDDLAKMMDDRIVELHKAQGGQQARHAYIFYREKVWNAMRELNQGIKIEN